MRNALCFALSSAIGISSMLSLTAHADITAIMDTSAGVFELNHTR